MQNGEIVDGIYVRNLDLSACQAQCSRLAGLGVVRDERACEAYYRDQIAENSYARDACPAADPGCCKRHARDNDIAYYQCMHRPHGAAPSTESFEPPRNTPSSSPSPGNEMMNGMAVTEGRGFVPFSTGYSCIDALDAECSSSTFRECTKRCLANPNCGAGYWVPDQARDHRPQARGTCVPLHTGSRGGFYSYPDDTYVSFAGTPYADWGVRSFQRTPLPPARTQDIVYNLDPVHIMHGNTILGTDMRFTDLNKMSAFAEPLTVLLLVSLTQENVLAQSNYAVRPFSVLRFQGEHRFDNLGFASSEEYDDTVLDFQPEQVLPLKTTDVFRVRGEGNNNTGRGEITTILFLLADLKGPFLRYGEDVRLGFLRNGRVLGLRVDPSSKRVRLCEYTEGQSFRFRRSVPFADLEAYYRDVRHAQTPLYTEYAKSFLANLK